MNENEIAEIVVEAGFVIHRKTGPGLFESVYETLLHHELQKRGLGVVQQAGISFEYDSIKFDEGFRADLIVENKVIIELKSVEKVSPVHKKQLLTYLRLADKRLGLLMNFGEGYFKDGITRIANGL